METRPTDTDYSDPRWFWPSWKFNLPLDALFKDLFDQYNTSSIPIQEPVAFHHDVSEICAMAATVEEFHVLLRKRRAQRLQEVRRCWDAVSIRIASSPPVLQGDDDEAAVAERWAAFLHFSREFSFDALARYFSLYTHKPSAPPLEYASSSSSTLSSTVNNTSTIRPSPTNPPTISSISKKSRKGLYSESSSKPYHGRDKQSFAKPGESLDDEAEAAMALFEEERARMRRSSRIAARATLQRTKHGVKKSSSTRKAVRQANRGRS